MRRKAGVFSMDKLAYTNLIALARQLTSEAGNVTYASHSGIKRSTVAIQRQVLGRAQAPVCQKCLELFLRERIFVK
jgi:hypothetical protein